MRFVKRIFVFMAVNILIVSTISIVLSIFNIQPYLQRSGLDYSQLAVFCLIWGFGGAFISLGLSRIMAKWMMGVKLIKPTQNYSGTVEEWVVDRVHNFARDAGLEVMPEVGIYESPELNAFATGPTKNRSLVAVSRGLLDRMDRDQVEGVLAHEVAHIANGDMVTMTLVQGVMNAFVMFIARAISFALSQNVKEESRYMVRFVTTIVLEILLSVLAMFVVAFVSRAREFRADKGGANLAGREKMIRALEGLKLNMRGPQEPDANPSLATLKISGRPGKFLSLLSTHPPLDKRIQALRFS